VKEASVHKAIQVLMDEHRLIEKVLASLEAYAVAIRGGRRLERSECASFAEFFRSYADACHHGKEEDLLFRRMIDFGFPKDSGPIAVMLYEHTVGRGHVGALREIGGASGPSGDGEQATFVDHAEAYVPMLLSHIQKEDGILYPMALRVLPEDELVRLAEQYEEFQAKAVGAPAYEEMQRLAERLIERHPFPAGRLEAAAPVGCGSLRG
jgi:hemerythrin-like domain-containing protein